MRPNLINFEAKSFKRLFQNAFPLSTLKFAINLISQVTVATLEQRARKSEQLDNIEKDRIIQRIKDAEERKRWRQKLIKMRSGKMGNKMPTSEPPIVVSLDYLVKLLKWEI